MRHVLCEWSSKEEDHLALHQFLGLSRILKNSAQVLHHTREGLD